jgi:hypothetical protein
MLWIGKKIISLLTCILLGSPTSSPTGYALWLASGFSSLLVVCSDVTRQFWFQQCCCCCCGAGHSLPSPVVRSYFMIWLRCRLGSKEVWHAHGHRGEAIWCLGSEMGTRWVISPLSCIECPFKSWMLVVGPKFLFALHFQIRTFMSLCCNKVIVAYNLWKFRRYKFWSSAELSQIFFLVMCSL